MYWSCFLRYSSLYPFPLLKRFKCFYNVHFLQLHYIYIFGCWKMFTGEAILLLRIPYSMNNLLKLNKSSCFDLYPNLEWLSSHTLCVRIRGCVTPSWRTVTSRDSVGVTGSQCDTKRINIFRSTPKQLKHKLHNNFRLQPPSLSPFVNMCS